MSSRIRQTVSFALVLAMLCTSFVAANAQRRPYRMSDRQVDELIRRVENSTDRFRATLANALDRSVYDGSRAEDDINGFVQNFERATDTLRDRFNRRVSVSADVENVLRQATDINSFMLRNRLTQRAQNDWSLVRNDLSALAQAYGVVWQWNQTGTTLPPAGSGVPSRLNDRQVATIIGRIETRTDSFRASVDRSLDRSVYDGTRAENNINQFIRDFEMATDTLRDRFNSRRSVASDVETVLQRAAAIDDFMRRNRMSRRAENEWSLLRTDLSQLATAYNVAWNWDSTNTFPTPGGGVTAAANRLTGTYRLDPTRSDNARDVAERAVRNLPYNERQRVTERLTSRLESPDMLAIERTGSRVTIASSRAPQTTFEADGRESVEQLPNGRTSRVTASLAGDRLVVRSAGYRENDFTVTFDPINGGRQLQVTREIWNERLGANPVVVRNVYDRTSDVADFNVYNATTASTYPTYSGATGEYAVRDGEMLVAAMNTDLTSRTAQVGDRFTMTVREPAQYRGATIEGRVANVSRSGRVTGRSDIALDFENIRMPDGRTYRFAGFIETVRTPNGETVQVDNEGTVRDDDSRGTQTAQRAAIGTAVGAIIGAIAGGGKGAAIGAIIGAGAGAGSVYVQGREDIELLSGTELTIRASAPNR